MLAVTLGTGCEESPHSNDAAPISRPAANDTLMTATDSAEQERRMIDYGHMRDGVLYHGTISNLDGKPLATWTFELDGEKTTQTRELTEDQFESIWNGMAESSVFKNSLVTDSETRIDPIANHIVSAFYSAGDSETLRNYSVPANEDDPAFLRWLKMLQVPKGSL